MLRILACYLAALFFPFCLLGQTSPEIHRTPFSIGETVSLHSDFLKENRTMHVYLPDSYHGEETKSYPVIYLLDGSREEDFIHIAGLVQFATFPWIDMIPESIVVGISNVDRRRDFTFPTRIEEDKKDFPTTGGSKAFISFLGEELEPFIEEHYRVTEQKTLIGQSLGGLLATEVLFNQPEMFSHYLIVSPSLWWDDQSLLAQKASFMEKGPAEKLSVFVVVGEEGKVMIEDARSLAALLKKAPPGRLNADFLFLEGQEHGNILHMAVYKAFEKLYKM